MEESLCLLPNGDIGCVNVNFINGEENLKMHLQ